MRVPLPALSSLCLLLACAPLAAQAAKRDQALYRDDVLPAFMQQEEEQRDRTAAAAKGANYEPDMQKERKQKLSLDFTGLERPRAIADFKAVWHFPPKRQWWTGTCWCFSTTSFLESELKRTQGREIKLSEMFTVYWDYVEKVREFVRTKGASIVEEGGESGDVLACWTKYGIVPEAAYTGLKGGETVFNHALLVEELHSYLDHVKKTKSWDEALVVASVRLILDKHLGAPPAKITVEGREQTPLEFYRNVVKLKPEDYVEIMSFQYAPFWTQDEYRVADNWAHTKNYWNVPLEDWYCALKGAVAAGYGAALGGDVSEPGYEGAENLAIVPTFDIPAAYIDQSAREFRFANHTTEDDHGIHAVGFLHRKDHDWFLIKDSARSSHRGHTPGYYFYRDDYMKLKMLTFMVHRDAVKALMAKYTQLATNTTK